MDPKRLIGVALICFGVVFYFQRNVLESVQGHGNDFAHLYLGARAIQQNVNPYDGAQMRQLAAQSGIPRMNPYVYPPLMAIALCPLASVGYEEAKQTWFFANQVFLFLSLVLLLGLWRPKLPILSAGFLVVVFAFFYPLTRTLTAGQLNALLLLLFAASAFLEKSGWSLPAGAIMGLASVIKVYPALFLVYYVGRGNWKAVCSMLIVIVLLLGLSVAVAGLKTNLDYFPVLTQMSYGSSTWTQYGEDYQVEPSNQSPSALYYRLLTTNRGTHGFFHSPLLAKILSWATGLGLFGVLLVYLVLSDNVSVEKGFSLTLLTALLVPSLLWDHYLLLVLIPVFLIASRYEISGGLLRATVWGMALALMAIPFNYWAEGMKTKAFIPLMSMKLYPLLAVYLLCWLIPDQATKAVEPHQAEPEEIRI